jgi:DNA-binding Lrp family transcriptional regulator
MKVESEIGEIDRKLLRILVADAKRSYADIGKELGVSSVTVHNRIKKLEEFGYVKHYVAVCDPNKLGRNVVAYTLISTRPGEERKIAEEIANFDEITEIYGISGEYDLLIRARVESIEKLNEILMNRVRPFPGVLRTHTIFTVFCVKQEVDTGL